MAGRPLSLAAEKGNEASVDVLLKHPEVKMNQKDHLGRRPCDWAASCTTDDVLALFLYRGADILRRSSSRMFGCTTKLTDWADIQHRYGECYQRRQRLRLSSSLVQEARRLSHGRADGRKMSIVPDRSSRVEKRSGKRTHVDR